MRVGVIAFLWFVLLVTADASRISVDPRDPQAYQTLREAVVALKPGDTLWLAPGSGPYREELHIRTSGTAEKPIVVEGNGNEVTGFDRIVFSEGVTEPHVKYPFVLRHNGRRIAEESAGKFGESAAYETATNRLSLLPGVSPEGWEISARKFVVRIQDSSYQTYRNLVASGSLNDGFNLHGQGDHLLFEKVTGRQNLDEGFSAHGTIQSEVRDGRFFENDNGMLSGQKTRTTLDSVDLWDNLGLGLGFNGEAEVKASNVRVWNNGMVQLLLRAGVTAEFQKMSVFRNTHKTRPWITYNETARRPGPVTDDIQQGVIWLADQPDILDQIAPTPTENETPPTRPILP